MLPTPDDETIHGRRVAFLLSTLVVVRTLDDNVCIQLLQLSLERLHFALGAAELRVHLLALPLVRDGPAQILRALLDLQLLADLPADPLAVLVQPLLHAGVREVRVLVQAELLEHRQAIRVGLEKDKTNVVRCRGRNISFNQHLVIWRLLYLRQKRDQMRTSDGVRMSQKER